MNIKSQLGQLIHNAGNHPSFLDHKPEEVVLSLRSLGISSVNTYVVHGQEDYLLETGFIPTLPMAVEEIATDYSNARNRRELAVHYFHRAAARAWRGYPRTKQDAATSSAYISNEEVSFCVLINALLRSNPGTSASELEKTLDKAWSLWPYDGKRSQFATTVLRWCHRILNEADFCEWLADDNLGYGALRSIGPSVIRHPDRSGSISFSQVDRLLNVMKVFAHAERPAMRLNPEVSSQIQTCELIILPIQQSGHNSSRPNDPVYTYAVLNGKDLRALAGHRSLLRVTMQCLVGNFAFDFAVKGMLAKESAELWAATSRQVSGAVGHEVANGTHFAIQELLEVAHHDRASSASVMRVVHTLEAMNMTAREIVKLMTSFEPRVRVEAPASLVEEARRITTLHAKLARVRVSISNRLPAGSVVDVDRVQIVLVLVSLIRNAIDGLRGYQSRYARRISFSIFLTDNGNEVCIQCLDSGPGFTESALSRCFERGYSTKKRPGGGIGLFMALRAVQAHGGRIAVENRAGGRGASVSVFLPNHGVS